MKTKSLYILAFTILVCWQITAQAETLTLENFLKQVQSQNQAVQSSQVLSEGAQLRFEEGNLALSPSLFANGQFITDRKKPQSPAFQGRRTDTQSYSIGLKKLFDFGLSAEVSYNLNHIQQFGTNPAIVPFPEVYITGASITLTQSLWRNGFGAETRANISLANSQAQAVSYENSFRVTALMTEAEITYWRLALARENTYALKDTLARATKIKDWSSNRYKLQLADRADLLQAEAAVLGRKLELKAAEDDERAATRAFNTARGIDSETVSEKLVGLDSKIINRLKLPNKRKIRDDLKAAMAKQNLAMAGSEAGRQANKPVLNVFVTAAANGRDPEFSNSFDESSSKKYPYAAVGMQFSMPTDFQVVKNNQLGHEMAVRAAQLGYQRLSFEQERFWEDLIVRFDDAKQRYNLSLEIEKSQKVKLEYEKERQNRGRSTTYQVLLFEQDFALSQLNRIKIQTELLGIYAQIKTFAESEA